MVVELRRAPRYPIVANVEIRHLETDIRVRARTSDLSTIGCYVDTLNPLPAGTEVELRISHNDETMTVRGAVAYCRANLGMGIEFAAVQRSQLAVIRRWLDKIDVLH